MLFEQKLQARNLRKKGLSIRTIASKIGVSGSAVSNWCKDIELTSSQLTELRSPFYKGRREYQERVQNATALKIKTLKEEGKKEIGDVTKRELFLIGISLYWSEGFKKDSQVGFANSDPKMINLFLKWLYVCFNYEPKDIISRVTANVSHKERINEIEQYWSNKISIPIEQFHKPFYQSFKWKRVYKNPNQYYGVLRIKVRKSKDFLRKIHGYIEGMQLLSES